MLKQMLKARRLMKDKFWKAKQDYLKFYEELPIDEKAILLESEHGKKMDGNIFYLVRYLATSEKYKDYTVYLSSMGRNLRKFNAFLEAHGIEGVKTVMLASEEYLKLLASAKYLINDTSFGPYFVKKEGQVYINTWHGTPLKALGKSDVSGYHTLGNVQSNFLKSDYLLYPNEYTRDIMLGDYMLYNMTGGKTVLSGYPRNEIFFDGESRERVRGELELDGKRVYVYMPTYRGSVGKGKTSKSSAYLTYYLYEMDKALSEDEVLYVNLHPLACDAVDFNDFKNIKRFPAGYEVYEFLNVADVLITDYSSVFFDFAVTGRKTVLFTYDEEEYLATRGMYMDMRTLPFPRVYGVDSLFEELRREKNYDDSEFLATYCAYESKDASGRLCDAVILGEKNAAIIEPIPDNGKKNVLIYAGNLAGNGITTSLMSLLSTVDTSKNNYIVTFKGSAVARNKKNILKLPEGVSYVCMLDDYNVTVRDRIYRKLFKQKTVKAKRFMKKCEGHLRLAMKQYYGDARIDTAIQFNGYESEVLMTFAAFPGNNAVFVHSNMVEEIKTKGNQRPDVLKCVYNRYKTVAAVTVDMIPPTRKLSGRDDNIRIVKNAINYKSVLAKAELPFDENPFQRSTHTVEQITEILDSDAKKFISIGRFSPEKAHDRLVNAFAKTLKEYPDSYLFIIGGYSISGGYEKLLEQVESAGLSDRIVLILGMPNPYNVLKKCDSFILSSLYEGFGLVLAEADILGLPVVSTDIRGPRTFMQKHGGVLVESSEEGVLDGMLRLARGEIKPLGVDYEAYNREVVAEFESIL